MSFKTTPQIYALWKIAIFVTCDVIQLSRNKRVFEGKSTSFFSSRASNWAIVKEVGKLNLCHIYNSMTDILTVSCLKIKVRFPISSSIEEVN